MNATHLPDHSELSADILSVDPKKRVIELDFIDRLISQARIAGKTLLLAANSAKNEEKLVAAHLETIKNPVFERIAQELAKNVPEQKGFGKFRQPD